MNLNRRLETIEKHVSGESDIDYSVIEYTQILIINDILEQKKTVDELSENGLKMWDLIEQQIMTIDEILEKWARKNCVKKSLQEIGLENFQEILLKYEGKTILN